MKYKKLTKEEFAEGLKALEKSCENRFCMMYDEWKPIKCTLDESIGEFNMKKCKCRTSFNTVVNRRIKQCREYVKEGSLKDPMKLIDMMDCRLNKKNTAKYAKKSFADGTMGKYV